MKKFFLSLLLMISLFSFAGDDHYDGIADKLEAKYHFISDGKNQLKIDDIEIYNLNGKPYINIEIKSAFTDGGWSKFNKAKYDEAAKKIADDVREAIGSYDEIGINLILDRKIGKDKMLSEGKY